ncbi:MAG: hypothetical protein D6729_14820 [Deltaproteobacteria bacterium]|nr:MAG: hypothetical protein D6729_14820 [Deltaproteobacteria bacterium]
MGRLSKLLFAFLILLLGAYALLSIDWRPERKVEVLARHPPGAPFVVAGRLHVGAAERSITPDHPVPLGGYGSRRGATFEGVRDTPKVRAVALGDGRTPPLVLVGLDLVLVSPPLAEAIRARAAEAGAGPVVTAATHTHNGPGGIWDNPVASLLGLGPYDEAYFRFVVDRTTEAVASAIGAMEPSILESAHLYGLDLCESRIEGRKVDDRLDYVHFEMDSGAEAALLVFACHPTTLGASDRRLSAEWPGAVAEALPGVTLTWQGAVAEATPKGPRGEKTLERIATSLAETALALPLEAEAGVAYRGATLRLPAPTGATVAPPGLQNLAGNLLTWLAPDSARVGALRLGGTVFFLTPGEVAAPLASRWRRRLGESVRVVSLVDGYVGYLETPEALAARAGESRQAYYGAELIEALAEVGKALVAEVEAAAPAEAP